MAKVIEQYAGAQGRPVFLCDFSPPRGADLSSVEEAGLVGADFLCVAYAPGKSVRVDSAIMAYELRRRTGKDVAFNLACRDMNKVAIQGHLLGAHLLRLENVVVLRGDPFDQRDLASTRYVGDYQTTGLIKAIKELNKGVDFRGLKLRVPTDFCVGATLDLGRDLEREAELARRKVEAGADFFLTQPIFEPGLAHRLMDTYRRMAGVSFPCPVFYGLHILHPEGLVLGDVPQGIRQDLERGRSGTEIALELLRSFVESGLTGIYLVPPILRGGRRDYGAARKVLEAFCGR
ncbi:MAG: methylenetetrahydrofolate reductase [Chloroflexi bacterium]|nr:methylenetetrahydrofolate reductase [Chloroflexota bacterium]